MRIEFRNAIAFEQLRWDNWNAVCDLMGDDMNDQPDGRTRARGLLPEEAAELFPLAGIPLTYRGLTMYAVIPTPEGDQLVVENDWIVRDRDGHLYRKQG